MTIVGLALAGMSWITISYLRLARQQVELVMAGGRVEAASRARVGLVVNLLHSAEAFSCLEEARRAGLALAASRAGRAGVTGSATVDPESYGDFLTAQQSLSGALEGVWPAVVASGAAGAPMIEADLRAGLDRAAARLTESIAAFDHSLLRYRAASRRFPASLIVGLVPDGTPPGTRVAVGGGSVTP